MEEGKQMRRPYLIFGTAGIGALAAGALTVATLIAPAAQAGATTSTCGSSAGKCYQLTVSPAATPAGASASFSFTITNEATTQQLGSAQITAPAGFVITSAPGSASFTPSSARFLNLAIAPSGQATLHVSVTAPCGAGSYQWGIQAKQSNDFSGPPGNDFQLDPSSANNLTGAVTGSCSLKFVSTAEPAATVAGKVITSGLNSSGGPIQVAVLDGSHQLATASTAAVTVAIGTNAGAGTLSGTTTVSASSGIASFADLSIDKAGTGYTLVASSPGITPDTSSFFTIWGSLSGCSGSCSGSASSKTTVETVTTSGSGQTLGIGLGGGSFLCGSYGETTDPVTFDLLDSSGAPLGSAAFSGALEIPKSSVQSSGHPGASSWQICYASTTSFTAQPNTSGTVTFGNDTYFTGLLPNCSSTQPAPCVQARNKDNAGDVVITFLATGDPKTWG